MGSSTTAASTAAQPTVSITYEGQTVALAYHGHQPVHALLQEAIAHLRPGTDRDGLALFAADDRQLPDGLAVEDAGVRPGDRLEIRPALVYVIYNGRTESFPYRGDELVGTLLQLALQRFTI